MGETIRGYQNAEIILIVKRLDLRGLNNYKLLKRLKMRYITW